LEQVQGGLDFVNHWGMLLNVVIPLLLLLLAILAAMSC
jgi:hypothetical protein